MTLPNITIAIGHQPQLASSSSVETECLVDVGSEATRRAHHWLCCCPSSWSPRQPSRVCKRYLVPSAESNSQKSLQEVVDVAVLSNELHGSLTAQQGPNYTTKRECKGTSQKL